MKKLCTEQDCFKEVEIDILTERYSDGTPHVLALKCDDCTTSEDIKKLKRFRKKKRKEKKELNKKL